MNSGELKRACEMAGLEWDTHGYTHEHGWVAHTSYQRSDGSRVTPIYHPEDPALLPYVAQLLKDQIYSKDGLYGLARLDQALLEADGAIAIGVNSEEFIRTAVAVLEFTPVA